MQTARFRCLTPLPDGAGAALEIVLADWPYGDLATVVLMHAADLDAARDAIDTARALADIWMVGPPEADGARA